MSANNGIIRIGRKGIAKFAFGSDGEPFEVDVVVAFQRWIEIELLKGRGRSPQSRRRVLPALISAAGSSRKAYAVAFHRFRFFYRSFSAPLSSCRAASKES